jgi:hypothetical protein
MHLWIDVCHSALYGHQFSLGSGEQLVDIFNVNLVAMLIAGVAIVSVFVYVPIISDFAFWFMLAAYLLLFHHKK